ncbi:ATP-binding cassette subfamily C protein PrsD [Devosia sp. UYZn731]|uniref:type I secretion system permease/ATPase n=1 Tax=Devosia sp. UYZn731 TaxID=3156345 RepID=UPI0033950F2E
MTKPLTSLERRASGPAASPMIPMAPLAALFIVSLISNLLMLTGPLFMLQVYDRVLASKSVPTLVVLTFLITALYGFYAFLETLRSRMATRFGNVIDASIGERLFAASIRLKLMTGAPANADPVRDGDTLRQFVSGPGPMALLDLPWLPIYMAVVFMLHPALGWLAVGGGLIIILLMAFNEALSRKPSQQANAAMGMRQRQTDTARTNAETIIAMGMLADVQTRWRVATQKLVGVQRVAGDRAAFFSSVTKGMRFLLQSGVLALGAYLVIQGQMTGGLMIAASVISSRALAPVEQIVGQWRGFIGARQAYRRISKILGGLPVEGRDTRLPLPNRLLIIKQLTSGPQGAKVTPLMGITLELNAGEALGVLGPSGAGKSSFARALVGVWPVTAGELRLDGAMLAHYDPSQIGQIIGYLPQRVELFDGTVAENIARFRPDATSDEVIDAARAANIHDLINSLPNGYDTQIGEQGDLLSAGQRQRLGLARALFGQPFLLVLDEPNSNLDAEGDAALSDAVIQAKARGAIVVVVAHRPSAIAAVDKLLFLKNGRQAAFGPKNDVLQQITQQSSGDNVRAMKVPVA